MHFSLVARLRDELEPLCRRSAGARGQSAVRVEQLSRARDRQAGGAAAGHDADAFDEPPRPGVAGVARTSIRMNHPGQGSRLSSGNRPRTYPRASSHAEKEELENSTHARGTRAGTKAGDSLVILWTVPACVPARGEWNWKIPFTPAGRGRVRKLGVSWWFSGLYPRAKDSK